MKANQATFSIAAMCRVLRVSRSGYYAWLKRSRSSRAEKDTQLSKEIRSIHQASRATYGVQRIHQALRKQGCRVSRKRVARLMRAHGMRGICRQRRVWTTRRNKTHRPAADLVQREFQASRADQLWVADITYIATREGFLYLAMVMDVFSRRIVGWSISSSLHAELVIKALDMALTRRRPDSVIHHSDQGCQYTSYAFWKRCREAGVRQSMGSVGDCYDNAMSESFFATLECELIVGQVFNSRREARDAMFEYIEGFYNRRRIHSSLGYQSPMEFEENAEVLENQA